MTKLSLAILMALVLPFGTVRSAGATHLPTPVAPGPGPQTIPRTDGQTVVWSDDRSGDPTNPDIYGARLSDRQAYPIAGGPAAQTYPDIDGGIVVWTQSSPTCPTCQFDIAGKNLSTQQEFTVAASPADETEPAISGSWVIWLSNDEGTITLKARDISTMAAPVTVARLGSPPAGRPAVSGDRVVWGEQQQGADHLMHWRLLTRQITAGSPSVIAEGSGDGLFGYDLAGTTIAYVANGSLDAVDLQSGQRRTIATQAQNPTTDGRYVFWEDYRFFAASDGHRVDLQGFDLASNSRFPVVVNSGHNGSPQVSGGVLVWQQSTDDTSAVQAAPVWDRLPSGPRPNPGTTSQNWLYFTETSHYLAFGFKDFWLRSGGLPVFGYPLTEEFDEATPDSGQFSTVQYLERQRFEYHPELAGTPYETELGRLGAEDAQLRGLFGTPPFQPLPTTTASDANCTFFPQTGHRLCFGFRAYWMSHGLEFGDPGVSYREALALFGYPISEEFTDTACGCTVQYFERARFEYHLNNPDPYRVLLGRLGAVMMAERGW